MISRVTASLSMFFKLSEVTTRCQKHCHLLSLTQSVFGNLNGEFRHMMRKDFRGCPHFSFGCHHSRRLANSARVVGRRAMFLSSSVFLASVGGGPYGAVSQGSGALDGTLFDSAYDVSHLVVFFYTCNFASALHEHQSGQRLSGKTCSSRFP